MKQGRLAPAEFPATIHAGKHSNYSNTKTSVSSFFFVFLSSFFLTFLSSSCFISFSSSIFFTSSLTDRFSFFNTDRFPFSNTDRFSFSNTDNTFPFCAEVDYDVRVAVGVLGDVPELVAPKSWMWGLTSGGSEDVASSIWMFFGSFGRSFE